MNEVVVPDIGDFKDIPVIEILVQPGDTVTADDPLVMLESDKAVMEVPARVAGRVGEILVSVGDRVSEGTPIARIAAAEEAGPVQEAPAAPSPSGSVPPAGLAAAPAPVPSSAEVASTLPAPLASGAPSAPPAAAPPQEQAHASPSVRRFARELGVDLARVSPTGPKGRILRGDVKGHVSERMSAPEAIGHPGLTLPPRPAVDFAAYGEIETVPLSRIRQLAGAHLARNWATIPHVTNFADADVTELEEFRKSINRELAGEVKVTILSFVIRACAAALRRYPGFNASLDGENLILKKYVNVGFAVDTPRGLVVPVVRGADTRSLVDIAREVGELSSRARSGTLGPDAMQGGTFSISSLGGVDGTGFTPIVNAPEVAILGLARARMSPVWDGTQFQPRLILPLSLSWDHRSVDGAAAGQFLAEISALLSDLRRILL